MSIRKQDVFATFQQKVYKQEIKEEILLLGFRMAIAVQ